MYKRKHKLELETDVEEVVDAILEERQAELADTRALASREEIPGWVTLCVWQLSALYERVAEVTGYRTDSDWVGARFYTIGASFRQQLSAEFKNARVGFRVRRIVYSVLDRAMPGLIAAMADVTFDGSVANYRAYQEACRKLGFWRKMSILLVGVAIVGWLL